MPTDYKGDKQKPSKMALIISVGPKMPKSPEDTSKPDDKAMKKAWDALKKQQDEPRRQPFEMDDYFRNLRNIANQAPIEPMPISEFPEDANPYQPSDEETRRKIMEMLPPIPPREERRNMMGDGTPHTPGQQSMIDRATEMYRQQKMRGE